MTIRFLRILGWQDITAIHKTIPYKKYKLVTTKSELICADNHIVFLKDYTQIFVKNLLYGMQIITDSGIQKVLGVIYMHQQQNMYDITVNSNDHRFYTNGILSHNSTSYSIFVLWYILMNQDKSVLICANKFNTAKDILQRVKLAYEMLPVWLKPGIVIWNTSSIEFSNGCKVTAEATSESSGRRTDQLTVLYQTNLHFLSPGIEQGFMASVFPVVSSSKTSQIIVVSTPNGMSNQYYRIWNKAILNKNNPNINPNNSWHPIQIDWWQVPGRDEKWKQMQLATFNGNEQRFQQEFGNSFLGSVATLISTAKIKQLKSYFQKQENIKQCYNIQLHTSFPQTKINMYLPPQRNRAYIIGADASTGTDSDYQAMTVWDVTNMFNIQLVASFYENNVTPKVFAYILAKTASLYNKAFIACENNGVSHTTIDYLWKQFQYENVIHFGGNPKTTIGIHSSGTLKFDACLNLKQHVDNDLRKIIINDGRLIEQMQRFQKRNRPGRAPAYMAIQGHDDLIMSMVWAFYFLKPNLVEKYFEVRQFANDKLNQEVPLFLTSIQSVDLSYENDIAKFIEELDKKFKQTTKIYNIPIQELQQNVKQQQQRLMKQFNLSGITSADDNEQIDQHFQFGGFFS